MIRSCGRKKSIDIGLVEPMRIQFLTSWPSIYSAGERKAHSLHDGGLAAVIVTHEDVHPHPGVELKLLKLSVASNDGFGNHLLLRLVVVILANVTRSLHNSMTVFRGGRYGLQQHCTNAVKDVAAPVSRKLKSSPHERGLLFCAPSFLMVGLCHDNFEPICLNKRIWKPRKSSMKRAGAIFELVGRASQDLGAVPYKAT